MAFDWSKYEEANVPSPAKKFDWEKYDAAQATRKDLPTRALEGIASLPGMQTLGEAISQANAYTLGPLKAGAKGLIDTGSVGEALRRGESAIGHPEKIPSGKEIAQALGVSAKPLSESYPGLYGPEWYKPTQGGVLDPSAAGVLGMAVDIPTDVTTYIPGAAFGKAAKGLFKGGEAIAESAISPVARGLAKRLASKGEKLAGTAEDLAVRALGGERGSIRKLGPEKAREVGRFGLEQGTVGPFMPTELQSELNSKILSQAGEGIGEIFKKLDNAGERAFNPATVAKRLESELGDFWRSPINRSETNKFDNILEAVKIRGDKPISFNEAQKLKNELGRAANWKNNISVTPQERMAREAYGIVNDELDKAVDKAAQVKGASKELQDLRKKYELSKKSNELLDIRKAREAGNQTIGLTDAIAGASTGAAGMAHYGTAEGALMGLGALAASKGIKAYGAGGLAKAFDGLAQTLKQSPETVEKVLGSVSKDQMAKLQRLVETPEGRNLFKAGVLVAKQATPSQDAESAREEFLKRMVDKQLNNRGLAPGG